MWVTRRRAFRRGGSAHACAGAAAGFSMIEVLIAAAILLIIALGLIPLCSRSINDNMSGNDASQATNGSRTEVEEMLQLPFGNQRLLVPSGSTELEVKDYWTQGNVQQTGNPDQAWWTNAAGHGTVLWNRTTHVQQYSISDLTDDGQLDTPLDGATQANFVQLKQVEVIIDNPKKNLMGNGQGITLRVIKPF
jgi:prepilin-type N-terminal cleavage/methylation domain-containing protein